MNDTLVSQIVETGISIGSSANGGGSIIPNVPNSLLTAIVMLTYGLIHRAIEKRKLRKAGKLNDK